MSAAADSPPRPEQHQLTLFGIGHTDICREDFEEVSAYSKNRFSNLSFRFPFHAQRI